MTCSLTINYAHFSVVKQFLYSYRFEPPSLGDEVYYSMSVGFISYSLPTTLTLITMESYDHGDEV